MKAGARLSFNSTVRPRASNSDAQNRAHIGSPILPIETRRIKARYGPIQVQRLATMQGIAEEIGEFIKRHGGLANDEDHRIGEGAQTPLRIFRQVELGLMTADVVISPL